MDFLLEPDVGPLTCASPGADRPVSAWRALGRSPLSTIRGQSLRINILIVRPTLAYRTATPTTPHRHRDRTGGRRRRSWTLAGTIFNAPSYSGFFTAILSSRLYHGKFCQNLGSGKHDASRTHRPLVWVLAKALLDNLTYRIGPTNFYRVTRPSADQPCLPWRYVCFRTFRGRRDLTSASVPCWAPVD